MRLLTNPCLNEGNGTVSSNDNAKARKVPRMLVLRHIEQNDPSSEVDAKDASDKWSSGALSIGKVIYETHGNPADSIWRHRVELSLGILLVSLVACQWLTVYPSDLMMVGKNPASDDNVNCMQL